MMTTSAEEGKSGPEEGADPPADDDASLTMAQTPNVMPWASGSARDQLTVAVWRRM